MRVRLAATALVAAAALLLAGCAGQKSSPNESSDGTPVAGGDATIVISGRTWAHLDVAAPAVTPVKGLINAIYDGLVRLSPEGKVEPWLAESFTPSADRLTWTFKLRTDVKFTDGTPFDAEAVKFNVERQLNPDQHAGESGNIPKDLKVVVVDDSTVEFKLSSPDESLLSALASTAPGLMASPTAVQKYGQEYGLHPVGTGPFMLESEVVGQSAKLVKNPNYWVKGEPYLDSVTYQVLGSASSALQTLKSGGANVMDFVQPQQAEDAKGAAGISLVQKPALSMNYLMLNTTTAPFNDERARRAVGYAVDGAALSKSLFFGFAQPSESVIGNGSWAYPGKTVKGYAAFDLEKAKKLVKEVGTIDFTVKTKNTPDFIQQMTAIQTMLAQAGIKMEIQPVEPSQLIADLFSKNYQAGQFVVPGLPDPDNYAGQFFNGKAGANPSGLHDDKLDALFAAGRTTEGDDARAAIYKQVAERMAELMPAVYVSDAPVMRLQDQRIHGIDYLKTDVFYLEGAWLSNK